MQAQKWSWQPNHRPFEKSQPQRSSLFSRPVCSSPSLPASSLSSPCLQHTGKLRTEKEFYIQNLRQSSGWSPREAQCLLLGGGQSVSREVWAPTLHGRVPAVWPWMSDLVSRLPFLICQAGVLTPSEGSPSISEDPTWGRLLAQTGASLPPPPTRSDMVTLPDHRQPWAGISSWVLTSGQPATFRAGWCDEEHSQTLLQGALHKAGKHIWWASTPELQRRHTPCLISQGKEGKAGHSHELHSCTAWDPLLGSHKTKTRRRA